MQSNSFQLSITNVILIEIFRITNYKFNLLMELFFNYVPIENVVCNCEKVNYKLQL